MKKFKRNRLLEMAGIFHRSEILKEGDDLFGDEGGDDEGGDDAGGDEGGDDLFGDDEGGDDSGGEEGGEEGEEGEEEEDVEEPEALTNDEIAEYGPGQIDTEIDNILQQIFIDSSHSAEVNSQVAAGYPGQMSDEEIVESIKNYSMKFLTEGEEGEDPLPTGEDGAEQFNLDYFTQEVARYIKNYQTLLDIEGMIFNKAKQFLQNQFVEGMAADFEEKLALVHGLDFSGDYSQDPLMAPSAAGATTAGGGGA